MVPLWYFSLYGKVVDIWNPHLTVDKNSLSRCTANNKYYYLLQCVESTIIAMHLSNISIKKWSNQKEKK